MNTCKDFNLELCSNCENGKEENCPIINFHKESIEKYLFKIKDLFIDRIGWYCEDNHYDAMRRFRAAVELYAPQHLATLDKLMLLK